MPGQPKEEPDRRKTLQLSPSTRTESKSLMTAPRTLYFYERPKSSDSSKYHTIIQHPHPHNFGCIRFPTGARTVKLTHNVKLHPGSLSVLLCFALLCFVPLSRSLALSASSLCLPALAATAPASCLSVVLFDCYGWG